jgi:hypothetical protein
MCSVAAVSCWCDANLKGEVALKYRAGLHSAFYLSKRKIEANWLTDDRLAGKPLQTQPTFTPHHRRQGLSASLKSKANAARSQDLWSERTAKWP